MDDLLDRLKALTKQRQYGTALGLCDEKLGSTSGEGRARVWRLRSFVHFLMQRYDVALEDVSAGLVENPDDMSRLFQRAIICVELHQFDQANGDLEWLLMIEAGVGETSFQSSAIILRVVCLTNLRRPQEALTLCESLPRDHTVWANDRLWSLDDLETEIRAQL